MLKIQLLPFMDESDCCACFNYVSEKIGFGHLVTCTNFFDTEKYFTLFFYAHGGFADFHWK